MNTDKKTDSSYNALIAYAAVALLSIAAVWGYLEYRDTTASTPDPVAAPRPATVLSDEIAPVANQHIGTSLNKARLAAEANMLVSPAGENALYFYGLVLSEDRSHAEANEELDSLLNQLLIRVQEHIAAAEFVAANRIAEQVSYIRPEHSLVSDAEQAWQQHQDELRAEESAASEAARLAAEQRARTQAAAAAAAARALETPEWLEQARAALAEERLIEPAGDNARDYLALGNGDKADQFRAQLISTLVAKSEGAINDDDVSGATTWLDAAAKLDPNDERLDNIAAEIKQARVEALAAEPISPRQLKRLNRVAAVYPRNAERRGTSGWVDMAFTVTTDGTTTNIEILQSEPGTLFDQAAIRAASQWLFEPHEIEGIQVNQRVMTRMSFQIEGD